MNLILIILIIALIAFVLYLVQTKKIDITSLLSKSSQPSNSFEKTEIFLEAKQKSFEIVLDAKNEALRIKNETDEYVRNKYSRLSPLEKFKKFLDLVQEHFSFIDGLICEIVKYSFADTNKLSETHKKL
jgi:hypothetical protein